MTTQSSTEGFLPPASAGLVQTPELPYNMMLNIFVEHEGSVSINKEFKDLVTPERIAGMGMVEIKEFVVNYQMGSAGDYIYFNVVNALLSIPAKNAGMMLGGHAHKAVTMVNEGKKEITMMIPSTLTPKINPQSGDLPMPKLVLSASKGVDLTLSFKLKFHGPITVNDSLKL